MTLETIRRKSALYMVLAAIMVVTAFSLSCFGLATHRPLLAVVMAAIAVLNIGIIFGHRAVRNRLKP